MRLRFVFPSRRGLLWILAGAMGCSGTEFKLAESSRNLVLNPELVDISAAAVGESIPFFVEAISTGGGDIGIVAIEVVNVEGEYIQSIDDPIPDLIETEETTVLSFSYTPLSDGYHWAQIIVKTDLTSDGERMIEARGQAATPDLMVWPGVIDFGPVAPGVEASDVIHVDNLGTAAIDIAEIAVDDATFSEAIDLPIRVEPGEQVGIGIRCLPEDDVERVETASLVSAGGLTVGTVELRVNSCSTASGALYDQDEDGYSVCGTDCDDNDPDVRPGATEVCNEVDDDCDGIVDEDTECFDDDGDGVTEIDGDCNDSDPTIYHGAEEDLTNGIDDDCDGVVDAGAVDSDGDGWGDFSGDCEPDDFTSYPGAPEIHDGRDNDCDGIVDEGTPYFDDDGDTMTEMDGDCDDSDPTIAPIMPEIPDWRDNDCDGDVDEDTEFADDDGDGFSEIGGDCDDSNAAVNPAALEIVGDGVDNDCDGVRA